MTTKRKPRVIATRPPRPAGNSVSLSPDVQAMISARHEAHRRGQFFVLGSISFLETPHGVIRFPMRENIPSGPAIGYAMVDRGGELVPDEQQLVVLTEWRGLPDLHEKIRDTQCPACLRDCDVCDQSGEKVCEGVGCGGQGFRPGPLVDCDGPDCMVATKKFNPQCPKCKGFGQVPQTVTCEMCDGGGKIKCPRCKGTGKYSTGIIGGGTDYLAGRCKACDGQQCQVKFTKQDLAKFVNAMLPDPKSGPWVAIGPIYTFAIDGTIERVADWNTPVKVFDVSSDRAGDNLFLLIDLSHAPQWPYMVGGFLRERNDAGAIMALRGSRSQE